MPIDDFLYDSNTDPSQLPREDVIKVTIADGFTNFDLFDCPKLESVTLPPSLTEIPSSAFESCTALKTIEIPPSVSIIGDAAFRYCFKLKSIVVPEGVRVIGREVFNGCGELVELTLPESLTEIGYYAFSPCTELTEFWIPNAVTKLGEGVFSDCRSIKGVYLGQKQQKQQTDDMTKHKRNSSLSSSMSQLKEMGDYLFYRCEQLQHISIPSTVNKIGKFAFHENNRLQTIVLPEGITVIEDGLFDICRSLISVTLPQSSLIEIKDGAFRECQSLIAIHIPQSVTKIGSVVFEECTALQLVVIPKHVTIASNSNLFKGCSMFANRKKGGSYKENNFEWFKTRFDKLPIHQACYDIGFTTTTTTNDDDDDDDWLKLKKKLLMESEQSSFCKTDDMGMTPLHVLCCNPYATPTMIKTIHSRNPNAAMIRNAAKMSPLDMFLVTRGILTYINFDDIKYGLFESSEGDESIYDIRNIVDASYKKLKTPCNVLSLCNTGKCGSILEVIFHLYENIRLDQELGEKDEDDGMYPFMKAAMMSRCRLDTLYTLLLTRPDLLKKE